MKMTKMVELEMLKHPWAGAVFHYEDGSRNIAIEYQIPTEHGTVQSIASVIRASWRAEPKDKDSDLMWMNIYLICGLLDKLGIAPAHSEEGAPLPW